MFICNSYDNNNKKTNDIKTMLFCHGNIPAEDYVEIRSLPLPSAFQTTT